jgi:hypothetical protein
VLYLYLCGGFPTVVREDERGEHEGHQLVAVFGDPMVAWLAYAAMRADAFEQLRRQARLAQPAGVHRPPAARPARRASDRRARTA